MQTGALVMGMNDLKNIDSDYYNRLANRRLIDLSVFDWSDQLM